MWLGLGAWSSATRPWAALPRMNSTDAVRAFATRYERLAVRCATTVQVGVIGTWLNRT